jgi:hypothetical protein
MLNLQKNIATEFQNVAVEILTIKPKIAALSNLYVLENMATLTDADYQTMPDFAHITVTEMTAAKNALDALVTAIGDYVTGTAAQKLARIVNRVP